MSKFETGKIYTMRSACDQDCVWCYEVMARTATTITIKDLMTGEVKRCKIIKALSEMDNREMLKPLGVYSMAPALRA